MLNWKSNSEAQLQKSEREREQLQKSERERERERSQIYKITLSNSETQWSANNAVQTAQRKLPKNEAVIKELPI